jgi:ankyrin repeat protein
VLISDMLDYGSDPNATYGGVSVLDAALKPGGSFDLDVVAMLVDPNRTDRADVTRSNPLNEIVKELCRNKSQGVDDPERQEFLLECIDILADAGVDVSAKADGTTPIMSAIHAHHTLAVQRLARIGALKHTDDGDILGQLCKDLRNMSEEPGRQVEMQDLGESIVTVIEAGANPNARKGKQKQVPMGEPRTLGDRYSGNSCIEHCMVAGYEPACSALIAHGCDLNTDHILSKAVIELCSIDPTGENMPDTAPNPTDSRYGASRMQFLIGVFREMIRQPSTKLDQEYPAN